MYVNTAVRAKHSTVLSQHICFNMLSCSPYERFFLYLTVSLLLLSCEEIMAQGK